MQLYPNNIFLIGPMGAGKTTIGRLLAKPLGYKFIDSDKEIEKTMGASIPWIFDIEGEEGFRKREHRVIELLSQQQGIVLATGGGCVVTPGNRECLSQRGYIIYLKVDIDQQLRRIKNVAHRPLLQTKDPEAKLKALIAVRERFYTEIADFIFDTNGHIATHVADVLIQHIQELRAHHGKNKR